MIGWILQLFWLKVGKDPPPYKGRSILNIFWVFQLNIWAEPGRVHHVMKYVKEHKEQISWLKSTSTDGSNHMAYLCKILTHWQEKWSWHGPSIINQDPLWIDPWGINKYQKILLSSVKVAIFYDTFLHHQIPQLNHSSLNACFCLLAKVMSSFFAWPSYSLCQRNPYINTRTYIGWK